MSSNTYIDAVPQGDAHIVQRVEFPRYILNSNKLKKVTTDEAIIELTSPVIKLKSAMVWRGMYNNKPISFKMNDMIFKNAVASNTAGIHDSYYFKAVLSYIPELQEDGTLLEVDYTVETVLGEVTKMEVVETEQGKRYARDKADKANQTKFEF